MWKYESCDIENISLHDHSIDAIQESGNNILLIFNDGFDVAKTHPLNDTGKFKHTATSQIILKNAKLHSGIMYRWSWQKKMREQEEIKFTHFSLSGYSFEVLDWRLNFKAENGTVKLCGNMFSEDVLENGYSELEFSCDDVLFCWNDYSEDAWLEGDSYRLGGCFFEGNYDS